MTSRSRVNDLVKMLANITILNRIIVSIGINLIIRGKPRSVVWLAVAYTGSSVHLFVERLHEQLTTAVNVVYSQTSIDDLSHIQ